MDKKKISRPKVIIAIVVAVTGVLAALGCVLSEETIKTITDALLLVNGLF